MFKKHFQLFENRNFRFLWIGQLMSIFGSRFSELAIPWIILNKTGSPIIAGIVAICTQIAPMVLAIPSGIWIERKDRLKVAACAECIRFLAMGSLAVAAFMGILHEWVIAFALLLLGFGSLLFKISIGSIIPGIVGRKKIVNAHNYIEAADAVGTIFGPMMAGVVFASLGAIWTLSIEAFTFIFSLFCIVSIKSGWNQVHRIKENIEDRKTKQLYHEAIEGLRYLMSHSAQRLITFNSVILAFSTVSVTLLIIILSHQSLHLSVAQTGMLLTAAGVGNIIGVFLLSRLNHFSWNKLLGFILFISAIGVFILSLATQYHMALIGMFLFDGALSMAFVLNGSARQSITPDRLLARISSTGVLIGGVMAISGNFFSGVISEYINPRAGLAICCALLFIAAAMVFVNQYMKKPIQNIHPIELE